LCCRGNPPISSIGLSHGKNKTLWIRPKCNRSEGNQGINKDDDTFHIYLYIVKALTNKHKGIYKSQRLSKHKIIISYGVTVLEGEAKNVCLLDLPLDAGNITKVVDVRAYCNVMLER
jgi:hypothetical protein